MSIIWEDEWKYWLFTAGEELIISHLSRQAAHHMRLMGLSGHYPRGRLDLSCTPEPNEAYQCYEKKAWINLLMRDFTWKNKKSLGVYESEVTLRFSFHIFHLSDQLSVVRLTSLSTLSLYQYIHSFNGPLMSRIHLYQNIHY